ncbi:hypothetical protein JZ751_020127, partial [Albula glossodonta]
RVPSLEPDVRFAPFSTLSSPAVLPPACPCSSDFVRGLPATIWKSTTRRTGARTWNRSTCNRNLGYYSNTSLFFTHSLQIHLSTAYLVPRDEYERSESNVALTSGTSTSRSGESPPSSLAFLFLLLRTLWMKFLWKSQMYRCRT